MPFKYTIDEETNKATLDIFVGGVIVTTYTFDNGIVTLSPLANDAVVHESALQVNLGYIAKWIGIIRTELKPPTQKRAKFTEDIDKKNNKVKAMFKNEGNMVTDADFDPDTRNFTFQSRGQITLNFNCFEEWYNFLYRFFKTGITF